MSIKPVVKWAGGKRQIVDKLIEYMPTNYNKYYEPFVGGGALLFTIMPQIAIINDINEELLAIYESLSDDILFNNMLGALKNHELHHSEEYYYKIRELDRHKDFYQLPIWQRAARTIYLNKTCFNGLYRVNSRGFFNVPSAKKIKLIHMIMKTFY